MTPEEALEAEVEKLDLEEQAFVVGLLQAGFQPMKNFTNASPTLVCDLQQLMAIRAGIEVPADRVLTKVDPDKGYTASNLKAVTVSEKTRRHVTRTSAVGFKGVRRIGARFGVYFGQDYVGTYDTPEDAGRAYDTALCRSGESGPMNFEDEHAGCSGRICSSPVEGARKELKGTGIVGRHQRFATGVVSPRSASTWRYDIEQKFSGKKVRVGLGGFLTAEAAQAARREKLAELEAEAGK